MKRLLAVLLTIFSLSSSGHAQEANQPNQWQVVVGDNGQKVARVANTDGHTLEISRATGKQDVWMRFELDPKSLDVLADRVPVFRVDEGDAADLDSLKRSMLGSSLVTLGSRQFSLLVFGGSGEPGPKTMLGEILAGKSFTLRYFLYGETYKDTVFPLTGAGPVIREALGMP